MKTIPLNERIIFALDFSDPATAKQWVEKLDERIKFYKVGLQLFLAGGWPVVDHIVGRGNKVMMDLKFFDIPETVHLAVQQLKNHGATYATVHGNEAILEGALKDKGELKILAVTVLTSFDESDMSDMGFTKTVQDLVLIRAKKACNWVVTGWYHPRWKRRRCGKILAITILLLPPASAPASTATLKKTTKSVWQRQSKPS